MKVRAIRANEGVIHINVTDEDNNDIMILRVTELGSQGRKLLTVKRVQTNIEVHILN